MNIEENIIFIENGKYSDIKSALRQWIEIYLDKLDLTLKFKLFKFNETYTVIELNKEIENELFNYLVNYLTYPENIKYKVFVKGFTLIKNTKIFPKNLLNQPVQIFVPKNDKEFDVVFGVVKLGETYKIDFGGKSVKTITETTYSKPNFEYKNATFETVKINDKKRVELQSNKKLEKFNFRFLIISFIFIAGTIIAGFLTYKSEHFVTVVKISSFGITTLDCTVS